MVSSSGARLAAPGGPNSASDSFTDYWYGTGSPELSSKLGAAHIYSAGAKK